MSEASLPLSSTALPAKVTVAWGSTLLDVRHLAPGASWWVGDLRVEATTHGTRVVSGDAVVMAAGRGETVKRAVAGLSLTLEPPAACERARGAAREVDVRFVKVVSVAALAFVAVVALFELTPLEDPTGGDVFAGLPVRLFVAPPVEKAVVRRPIDFRRAPPSASTAAAPLLAPRDPAGRARTPAAARARVTELVASLFGGGLGQVLRPGPNDAIDAALSALGPGRVEGSAEGLAGLNARSTGPAGPAGDGLSLGRLSGPGRREGAPAGFGVDGRQKQGVTPSPGPQRLVGNGLEKDVVMAVIRRHQSEIRFCYERELQKNARLSGKLAVTWTIDATGGVADAQLAESGVDDAGVEACVLERIRRWRFPEPRGGGVVIITFPWVFHVAGAED